MPREVLFDNAKTVVLERDVYGVGRHRWHPGMLAFAEEMGFQPRLCRAYREKTKGKVERFNRYLKGSFLVPLAATPKTAGLMLDVASANWAAIVSPDTLEGNTCPGGRYADETEVHG